MYIEVPFIVFPKHCNHYGEIIFGGEFMAQLDLAAAHCVRKILDSKPEDSEANGAVTHKAAFEFLKPAYRGDYLTIKAHVFSLGKKSIEIKVDAFRGKEHIATSSFVFITIRNEKVNSHPVYLPYVEHKLELPD